MIVILAYSHCMQTVIKENRRVYVRAPQNLWDPGHRGSHSTHNPHLSPIFSLCFCRARSAVCCDANWTYASPEARPMSSANRAIPLGTICIPVNPHKNPQNITINPKTCYNNITLQCKTYQIQDNLTQSTRSSAQLWYFNTCHSVIQYLNSQKKDTSQDLGLYLSDFISSLSELNYVTKDFLCHTMDLTDQQRTILTDCFVKQ